MNDDRRNTSEELESDGEIEDVHIDEEQGPKETGKNNVEAEMQELKNLASQLDNNYKRALADYQNLQRRTQEEKTEWIRMASRDMVLKLLPVLDTLMLAEKHTQDKNFVLTVGQFLQVLKDEGFEKIKTVGEEFNPQTMEAVSTQDADKKEKGKVVEEMRAGFIFGETVIRPAQVIVGR